MHFRFLQITTPMINHPSCYTHQLNSDIANFRASLAHIVCHLPLTLFLTARNRAVRHFSEASRQLQPFKVTDLGSLWLSSFPKNQTSTIGLTLRPTPAPSWPPAVAAANNSLHLALCKCFLRSKASVPSSGGWKLLNCWFPQQCHRDWYHLGSLKERHNQ